MVYQGHELKSSAFQNVFIITSILWLPRTAFNEFPMYLESTTFDHCVRVRMLSIFNKMLLQTLVFKGLDGIQILDTPLHLEDSYLDLVDVHVLVLLLELLDTDFHCINL